jgi:hypothetical protein
MHTVNKQEYIDSTQSGVCRKYTDKSIKPLHRQEYTDSTQTGVYTQYTNRDIQIVNRLE